MTISRKEYMRAYYERNKHKWKDGEGNWIHNWVAPPGYHRKYQMTVRGMFTRIKSQAKKRDIEFSIEESDIVVPDVCPVLGIPLRFRTEGGKPYADPDAPSLDRVDNSKGYVKGNVRVISYRANTLKKDATLTELEALVNYMKSHTS